MPVPTSMALTFGSFAITAAFTPSQQAGAPREAKAVSAHRPSENKGAYLACQSEITGASSNPYSTEASSCSVESMSGLEYDNNSKALWMWCRQALSTTSDRAQAARLKDRPRWLLSMTHLHNEGR